jgi:glutamate-ammonia-ligase adenylyltransferase
LDALQSGGYLDGDLARRIGESYRFLLGLVDALRVVRGNASDLNIPDPETRDFLHLAHRLSVDPPGLLSRHIAEHMASSRSLWDELRPPG